MYSYPKNLQVLILNTIFIKIIFKLNINFFNNANN